MTIIQKGEPMSEDTISRQAAIDICNNAIDLWHGQLGEGALVAVKKGIESLPSAEPKLDKNDMPEQGDSAKFGVITGETCAYWDSESNMCALHRPSAQPEIIHCKECKRQDTDNVFRSMWCHEMRTFVKPNEFCSRADMREEERDE